MSGNPAMAKFLSFSEKAARLCITTDREIDGSFLHSWELEGFDVISVPFTDDTDLFVEELNKIKHELSVGESYAVISFGASAAFCLEYYLKPPNANKICALVAYYPTRIAGAKAEYPPSMRVLVHLANQDVDVDQGYQGPQKKHRIERRHVRYGIGTGDHLELGYQAFVYTGASPGFAEQNIESYDHISANLAWSRTLTVLQEGFGKESDLESKWDEIQENRYFSSNMGDPLASYVREGVPSITYTPTLQGAIGRQALRNFYEESFVLGKPHSMQMRLLSRTVGADRVVDELYVHFKHTQEMPWILPGIPPTMKEVRMIMINIVSLRGGLLYSEHIYWDQASILVQVGLLDPKVIAQGPKGVKSLPITGSEAARQILVDDYENHQYAGFPKSGPGEAVHRRLSTDTTNTEAHAGGQ